MKSLLSRLRPDPASSDAPTSADVRADAEPFFADNGATGVLMCHGFTGSPRSLRPWAEQLAERGLSVALPRLPGHGTDWRELNQTRWMDWYARVDEQLTALWSRCAARARETGDTPRVFAAGLSMGGALALRLAERRPDDVAGLVLVNPALCSDAAMTYLLPILRLLTPSVAGIANDIAKPGMSEGGYVRTPLHAAYSMTRLFADVRARLPEVRQPLLLLKSDVDHVVAPEAAGLILSQVRSALVLQRRLHRSFHVATLDWDAQEIVERSAAFIELIAPGCVSTAPVREHTSHHTDSAQGSVGARGAS